ncbi:DNA/RNA non-specific endonuclease [Streptomyces sp. NPDC056323]|uniref:DNA/RNA non-specific endonuclease n=1 Tax=unclassified Streptomyces TaxID=2593676 RepID=UPI0035DE1B21
MSEPVAGKSAMAWSGDRLYLKGDSDFWAQQDPHYGNDLTSSGHWVAPEKRDGYYMLDSFAVNAGSLTPRSLAAVVTQVTSDPETVEQDAGVIAGHKAVAYTARGWTVVLTKASPYTVLAIGGDPSHQSPVKPAAWHEPRPTEGRAGSSTYRATAVPASYADGDYSSYLLMEPRPATKEQTTAARSTAASAAATAVTPAAPAEAVSRTMGPAFTITDNSESLCTTNPCSYSVTVTNSGDKAGAATLFLSFPQVPSRPHPLGTLQPKQSKQVNGTRPNIAPPGRTVRHTDYAWVYSSAEYGPDSKVGSRLHARNLRPDSVSVGTPLRPTVAKLLDLMTKDAPADDTQTGEKAVDALYSANRQGELPDLGVIADSGRLENPEDLSKVLPATDQVDNRRVVQQIAQLLRTDPQANVTWGQYKAGGNTYQGDYFYTSSRQGEEIRRAVRAKTVRSAERLGPQMVLGAEQLNGERQGSAKGGREKAPLGFERVLQISLEPGSGPLLALSTTSGLEQLLSTGQAFRQARESLCEPNGGSRVDRVVIVNESGTHEWTDPRRLGARCSNSKDNEPGDRDGAPSDCRRQGVGWVDPGTPDAAHGNRATHVRACLNAAYLKGHPGTPTRRGGDKPPGYDWARDYVRYLKGKPSDVHACHLLGAQLGGSGTNLANLVACGSDANSYVGKPKSLPGPMDSMLNFEDSVRSLVDSRHVVQYEVTPVYRGDRTVPHEIRMSYTAWDKSGHRAGNDATTVPNLIYTTGQGWKNLGLAIHSRTGADVPLPGQP